MKTNIVSCARCLYDETTPSISFDEGGVCNYCAMHDNLNREYPCDAEGEKRLRALADEIRAAGKGKKYDCVVGVSGGCDSSYLLVKMIELGLRPLAAHFDNTWNSPIATQNIYNLLERLNVDLFTIVVNNKEYDDIYRSFMLAGLKEVDAATDIGLAATLYRACEKYGVKYIIEGHSFRTEGVSPLGWAYVDGKYIESVHRKYGKLPLKTFPNLSLFNFLRWTTISNIKKVRPLYFIDYHKEEAKKFLADNYGWQWYGGHHLENRFAAFCHAYLYPRRFSVDMRTLGYSALIRSGQMKREEGAALMTEPPRLEPEILDMVKQRLGFSDEEFERVMTMPHHDYTEYQTYKKTFERLSWLFWILYKFNRVPKSFYMKYANRKLKVV